MEQFKAFETFELQERCFNEEPLGEEETIITELKDTTPKLRDLPMLSVSSPSPPHEEKFL